MLIASVVVAAMLVLAGGLLLLVGAGSQRAMLAASEESAEQIGQLIGERVHRIVAPADAALRLLVFDPLLVASDLPARLQRLPALAALLEQNPLLSAVFVGYADGQFLLVRPLRSEALRAQGDMPPGAAYLVQSVARETGFARPAGRWNYYDAQLRLLETAVRPEYRYDPRTRPWYAEAAAQGTQILTPPYVFFTTQEVGVTLSQRSRDGHAVIGLDVALTQLGSEIGNLRLKPRTEIAILDAQDRVLAYPDMARVLRAQPGESTLEMRLLKELEVPALQALDGVDWPADGLKRFQVAGEEWVARAIPLQSARWEGLRVLMAIPGSEVLAQANQALARQAAWSAGLIALMLPVGWWAGRRVGRNLAGLAAQAAALARFDFRGAVRQPSPIREVRALGMVMDTMSETIQEFLHITQHISAEPRMERMLAGVLVELVRATGGQGGAVYLVQGEGGLQRAASHHEGAQDEGAYPAQLPPGGLPPADTAGVPSGWVVRRMQVPLHTRAGQPLGQLVLDRRVRLRPGSPAQGDDGHFRAFVEKLSGMLSVAVETRSLMEGHKKLLDAIIRLLADAIDAKSPYTGGHCDRVPQLAEALLLRMCEARDGPFAGFSLNETELEEFRLGAWLHDCGKVTSPEHIIDKATKLETIRNRIHEVRLRFEVLWRDAEIAHWQRLARGEPAEALQEALSRQRAALQDDFAFIARCNIGGEGMTDADIQRLQFIGQQAWLRYFDDRLGLSPTELQRFAGAPSPALPATEMLLADRPEHIVPWGDRRPPVEAGDPANRWGFDMALPPQAAHGGELHNLSVRRGTLTAEDRFRINDHIVQTIVMLNGLPFPPHLARVPAIAGSHHEKLDGTGYPRRLKAQELGVMDRVMALADIFEALTASDRPYKPPKTLAETFAIMAAMVRDQHIDAEVFRFFVASGVWQAYADRFLSESQRDAGDVQALLDGLPSVAVQKDGGKENR